MNDDGYGVTNATPDGRWTWTNQSAVGTMTLAEAKREAERRNRIDTDNDRYWWSDAIGVDNLLDDIAKAAGHPIAGIVDEQVGGIIAYAEHDNARRIVTILNMHESARQLAKKARFE